MIHNCVRVLAAESWLLFKRLPCSLESSKPSFVVFAVVQALNGISGNRVLGCFPNRGASPSGVCPGFELVQQSSYGLV